MAPLKDGPNARVVLRTAARQSGWDMAEFDQVLARHERDVTAAALAARPLTPTSSSAASQKELAQGHLFRFTVQSKGVGTVVGDPHISEANWWSEPWTIEVRAFSLDAALRKVLDLGMVGWDTGEEGETS